MDWAYLVGVFRVLLSTVSIANLIFIGMTQIEGGYQLTNFMKFLKFMRLHQWDVKSIKNNPSLMIESKLESKLANEHDLTTDDPCADTEFKSNGRTWFKTICKNIVKTKNEKLEPVRL